MWKTTEGSTGRLLQLCTGYFFFYVITGVTAKYFTGTARGPGMSQMEYLVFNTIGGTSIALSVALAARWYRMKSNESLRWGKLQFPAEFLYIIPSGVCTAVVIPTTTLMYTLPISVMVAMVIMRGSIIVISRIVDAVQTRQGLLKKKVYREENLGIVFALLAVGATVFWTPSVLNPVVGWLDKLGISAFDTLRSESAPGKGNFEFLRSVPAMTILGSYILAYAIRIYIMNYFKNTRGKGVKQDNKGYFAIEQITASTTLLVVALLLFNMPKLLGWGVSDPSQPSQGWATSLINGYRASFFSPKPAWPGAIAAGFAFGIVSFFSVFIFMFKGRTATFAGLVNRLTSLVAGTMATLFSHFVLGAKAPSPADWLSLMFILVAVGFLTVAERKRAAELIALHEIAAAEVAAAPAARPASA